MNKIFKIKSGWLLLMYIIFDILCAGAGMGVPIFCMNGSLCHLLRAKSKAYGFI
jgi:hypothetical protein